MPRQSNIPYDFQFLATKVHYVQKVSDNEYASSCPNCGGMPHRSGEFPDRFRMWIKSQASGGPLGWCRRCGYIWTPKGEKLSPEKQSAWAEERKVYELERKAKVEHALSLLHEEQAWIRYHQNLTGEVRQRYHDYGLDDFWIDNWQLGYNPDFTVWDRKGKKEHHTPTLTIPVFQPGTDKPVNIRNRLLDPVDPGDKYRPEVSGLPSTLFYAKIGRAHV